MTPFFAECLLFEVPDPDLHKEKIARSGAYEIVVILIPIFRTDNFYSVYRVILLFDIKHK